MVQKKRKPGQHSPRVSGPRIGLNTLSYSNGRSPGGTGQSGRRGKPQRRILLDGFESDDMKPYSGNARHSLTLQQEGRNTEERSSRRRDDRQLRQLGVSFVAAQNTKTLDDPGESFRQLPDLTDVCENLPDARIQDTLAENCGEKIEHLAVNSSDLFFIDVVGDPALAPRALSLSSSSDEVVFIPRNKRTLPTTATVKKTIVNPLSSTSNERGDKTLNFTLENDDDFITQTSTLSLSPERISKKELASQATSGRPSKSRNRKLQRKHRDTDRNDSDDERINDYIQNVYQNSDINASVSMRALGDDDGDNLIYGSSSETQNFLRSQNFINTGAFSAVSSNHEVEEYQDIDVDVAAVIGKREGMSGQEYHFKPIGSTVSEAIWIESTDMTQDIVHLIDDFEMQLVDGYSDSDEIDRSENTTDDDDKENPGDHRKLPIRNDIIDDAKFARICQAEESKIYDQNFPEDDVDIFDDEDLINMMAGKPNKKGIFPSASRLADAYDEFDLMDRSRSSLTAKQNRRTRHHVDDLVLQGAYHEDEDAEVEAELQRYIAQDRQKKSIRKQEREELRKRGLLRSSSSKAGSMDVKSYLNGMAMQEVHVQIKKFLMSGLAERLALIPMSKYDRLQVHVIASKFFMTSKSQGKGRNRFPVLFKTKRTMLFEGDEEAIDMVFEDENRGKDKLKTLGRKSNRSGKSQGTVNRGAGDIKHKDGMVVGNGAAEISQGNKGYEMLARMGWTTGTGLGSDRRGILDPVKAVVKNSKAGLG